MNQYPYQQLSLFPQNQYQQPYMPQSYQQPQSTPPAISQSGIVWVNNEDEAKNYSVAPNNTVYFMNSNEPYFYAKSTDTMGRPTFRKCRLVDESENQRKRVDLTDYVKREEVENLLTDMVQKEVEKRMSEISFKPAARKQRQSMEDEE